MILTNIPATKLPEEENLTIILNKRLVFNYFSYHHLH